MILRNTAGILCVTALLVVAVSGHSYGSDVYGYIESRLLGSDMFYENAAATAVDFGSCETQTYENQCQTAEFNSDYPVHVCPKDDLTGLCYYSDVRTCCKNATSILKCKSVTNVQVGGEAASVSHYQRELSGEICISFSPVVDVCHGDCPTECVFGAPDCAQLDCDSNGANCVCKEGFSEESECCECADGHYRNGSRCIKFCRENCRFGSTSGPCTECERGYLPPTCCKCPPDLTEVPVKEDPSKKECQPERCDKQQNLFFYIDATRSNEYNNFCGLIVVMQMLVAAFNPSPMSGTQIFSVLFPGQNKPPSTVIDMGTSCLTAVEGSDKSLKTLMIDFGLCQDSDEDKPYDSSLFPSSCGEGTSAVEGLKEIHRIASRSRSSTEGAIVMLTDGVIIDNDSERNKVLSDLNEANIDTLIAAGIGTADVENLKLYTSESNILVGSDPVQLGIDIVNKMEERGIVCKEHADNITLSLREVQGTANLLKYFCNCHRKPHVDKNYCQRKYPTCGGSLEISLGPQKGTGRTKIQEVEDLEDVYVNQQLLEEEILAAVEKVLDQRYHG